MVGTSMESLLGSIRKIINNSNLITELGEHLHYTVVTKFSWSNTAAEVIKEIGRKDIK